MPGEFGDEDDPYWVLVVPLVASNRRELELDKSRLADPKHFQDEGTGISGPAVTAP